VEWLKVNVLSSGLSIANKTKQKNQPLTLSISHRDGMRRTEYHGDSCIIGRLLSVGIFFFKKTWWIKLLLNSSQALGILFPKGHPKTLNSQSK
jgi:hypothetical protein